ncbi:MAG: choice-of-anchor tandem repeat GloVer-containing protein, partial [Candidatus Cybelea sp.]
ILAVMVAGCGGGSTPLSPSPAGPSTEPVLSEIEGLRMTAAERTHVRHAYNLLYSFKGGINDGRDPHAGPLINVMGTLYGTTVYGGGPCHDRCFGGTVFAITTSGGETVLHSFEVGSGDGKNPRAGLIDVTGTLYGTTVHGGSASCYCGAVFKVTLSGAETVLHSFAGGPDGFGPDAGLLDVNGTLYGTTINGGTVNDGTVFAITTTGTETVLHSFAGNPDGAHPYAGLINVNGTLYGTTTSGGACGSRGGCGTVFTIAPSGAETVLYSFKGGSADGKYPTQADLLDVNGTLYGTTKHGGANDRGTVFSLTTSGEETVVHSFGGSRDGVFPYGGLIDVNGTLYGTTSNGGSVSCGVRYGDIHGCGTVFKTTTSGKESVLHSFGAAKDGRYPYAGLVSVNDTLYGTTTAGGAHNAGTVFSLSP